VLAWRARHVEWTAVCFAAPGRQRFLEVVTCEMLITNFF
jgi:hypothetical protein